ncbi:MAG: hypothetical protein M3N39_13305 [Pseudomonadota bacterium]|nr:hypothetical protein [Pseudomonadota bacterium]
MVRVHQMSEQFCWSGVTGMIAAFKGGVVIEARWRLLPRDAMINQLSKGPRLVGADHYSQSLRESIEQCLAEAARAQDDEENGPDALLAQNAS